jgi:hypothetical protein
MKTLLRIHLLVLIVTTVGCSRHQAAATVPAARAFTAEQLYADYRLIPGTVAASRPSPEDGRAVLRRNDLARTGRIWPREWPTDSGSIQFLYEPNGGRYWAYRVNGMRFVDPEWLEGPFPLPNGG